MRNDIVTEDLCSCCVGLPLSTTEGRLKKAFSHYGEVSRGLYHLAVKIVSDTKTKQPLGFAFVWFTSEESAQVAVSEMDGKVYIFSNIFDSLIIPKWGSDCILEEYERHHLWLTED
ncbi:hypothetical protein JCGZ_02096 [Jatropha curcas]|uniref:RRM domain-containing protein n=1 Tax=Jatropha curcas TaxID=180498 RepID=A0A067KYP2_JATCU|nr:hypothetical protein JCGZ_02096 [Jatropha curcas]